MKVNLTYFKPEGKYYASGEYDTAVPVVEFSGPPGASGPPLHLILDEVSDLRERRRLPGLVEGHSEYAVLIDVPGHPHRHPHLLPAEDDPSTCDEVRDSLVNLANSVSCDDYRLKMHRWIRAAAAALRRSSASPHSAEKTSTAMLVERLADLKIALASRTYTAQESATKAARDERIYGLDVHPDSIQGTCVFKDSEITAIILQACLKF